MKRVLPLVLLLTGCAQQLRTVDQATIHGAPDNVLCSEGNENAAGYTKQTLGAIRDEMALRGGVDCSINARSSRAAAVASVDELCTAEALAPVYFPALAAPSRAELDRRGATCDPQRTSMMVQAFIAKQQQEAQMAIARAQQQQAAATQQQAANAALLNGLFLLQQSSPVPRPVINCTSNTAGVFTNTTCR